MTNSARPRLAVGRAYDVSKWHTTTHVYSPTSGIQRTFAESEEFQKGKATYARKEELLQHLVDQQRAKLEQISVELQRTKAEVRGLSCQQLLDF